MKMRWVRFVGTVIGVLLVIVGFVHLNAAETIDKATADTPANKGETHHITLITGDKIIAYESPNGTFEIDIDPLDQDGENPQFEKLEKDDDIYVFPQDMIPFTQEKLDSELFNITRLIENGYSDEKMGYIPLIITLENSDSLSDSMQDNKKLMSHLSSENLLTSIHSMSAKLDKDNASAFHDEMYTYTKGGVESPYFDENISNIRLDRKLEAALQESVPQIGAPSVWNTGYDGSGTTIAVIDSGIDGNHPDLKDNVSNERNFSEDPTAEDLNGHGTHVASTIAGSGAASNGDRKGVAPGASLLNAKALGEDGRGLESSIISAMEWSAEEGADVINMSLGSGPTDGTDPVSQALDSITEESGALFVVASGNDGPLDGTASAPSTADLALSVGSVDKNDELATGSSRGPRVDDYAIKPDITAPGVGIIAARAEGTSEENPVDTYYTNMSGTSMAAPHVAGSAALLLDKWKDTGREIHPEIVKSALVSSAIPNDNLTVYEQGGGRVDIERAVHQDVFVEQAPLNMGYFEYPYSDYDEVEKQLTYYNMSDETVVLDVEANIEAKESTDIPEDLLTLEEDQITIEPGERFELDVHLDVEKGASGLYGGYITAESEDGSVAIQAPVGFYKEPKTHLLTIKANERNGKPALYPSRLDIMNADRTSTFFENNMTFRDETGEQTFEVPEGTYTVMGQIYSYEETDDFPKPIMTDVTLAGELEVEVTEDTVVHLDAREGNPIKVDLQDDTETDLEKKSMTYHRKAETLGSVTSTFSPELDIYAVPMKAPDMGEFEFYTSWHFVSSNDRQEHGNVYNLVFPESTIPQDLHYRVSTDDMARINHSLHTIVADDEYMTFRHVYRPYTKGSIATGIPIQVPSEQQEYVMPGDTEYKMNVKMKSSGLDIRQDKMSYPAKGLYEIDWLKQPFHPGIAIGDAASKAVRDGNELNIKLAELVDSENHWGYVSGLSQFSLFQDGDLIATTDRAGGVFDVTPGESQFRMELSTDTSDIWAPFSTKTNTTWTFHSQEPIDDQPENLALLMPDYDLDLQLNNTASLPEEVDGTLPVTFRIGHLLEDEANIEGANLWISYNDGDDWENTTLERSGDEFIAHIEDQKDNRDGSGYVSLKVEAWDVDQNRVDQEIIRAYRWNFDGDINGNDMIDIHDVMRAIAHYGTNNSEADINGDGIVDEKDMRILEKNFLKVAPGVNENISPLESLGGKGINEFLRSIGLEPLKSN